MPREFAAHSFENSKNQNRRPADVLSVEFEMVAVVDPKNGVPDFSQLPPLFHYFRRYNLIKLKVDDDNQLESKDLPELLASGWFYMAKNGISDPKEVTLTVLIRHLTPKILAALSEHGFKRKRRGVFCCNSDIPAYVISLEDLSEGFAPEELLAFSNPSQRRRVLLSSLGDKDKALIVDAIVDLYAEEVSQILAKNIEAESLKTVIQTVGENKVIAALGKKKVQSREELLAALNNKNTLAALLANKQILKVLLEKMKPEEIRKLLHEADRKLSKI